MVLVAIVAISSLAIGSVALANHGDSISGVFESADGNLEVDHENSTAVDWNSFTDEGLAAEWNFAHFEDRTGNPDDIFGGGVKQDNQCPDTKEGSLGGGNSKFDLSDIYLANKNIGGDEFLFVAWVRVPSSPSASSHIAYEFNKGTAGFCDGSTPDPEDPGPLPLPNRVEGDLLIVYDFEGGDADSAVKLARWLTAGHGHTAADCEVAKALPCWGDVELLTEFDPPQADAKVNNPSDVGPVFDAHRDEDLAPVRFGEAGINLTTARVFEEGECESFGYVTGVSRSSGNSGTAQMKDKVGTFPFQLGSCPASIAIEKVDDDGELLAGASFTIRLAGTTNGVAMTEHADGVFCADDLEAGASYIITETAPNGFAGEDPKTVTASNTDTCADRVDADGFLINGPDETFENEQLHVVIVIVCHQVDGTLAASEVTNGSATLNSLSSAPQGLTQAQLCALGGARFEDKEHGPKQLDVNVGSHSHGP